MTPEPWWRQIWRLFFATMFAGSLAYLEWHHIELPGPIAVTAFVLVLPAQELSGTALAAGCRAGLRWRAHRRASHDYPRATTLPSRSMQ